ncbi:outer membrane lipoprotein-sorting protein [Treponema phagedenis]|uniref:outer membrane lipoprotein-sorting protein n=1 Tax=Treponema phagedenis TaxID=162 RepID=UPI0001F63DCB|nr:outer membrane lipoprotein-sorting protein [Treponema phagedenis]EFW38388.1 hypothetical protein HMPREF9554_01104 [Treponema phagedenis F0421]QSH98700.1 outer membrane lipoprotein-sorting protein [Treponema phagedenis]TYT78508.1 outer membrane lipoprotein-sorting protein [Treponema phagedenis]
MKIKITALACILVIITSANLFAELPSKETLYDTFDRILESYNFTSDITWTLSLVVEKPSKPKEAYQYKLFRRDKSDQTCIVQLAPEVDKGVGYLQQGNNLWTYDPVSHSFTHSSIKKNLGNSDSKISDVSKKKKFRDSFEILEVEEAKVGSFDVYAVTVHALDSDAAYPKEKYYVRKDADLILKIESFGASGKHMRTTLIPKYVKLGKINFPVQQIHLNIINKGEKTTQIFSDFDTSKIPDMVFTKAYLEKIN